MLRVPGRFSRSSRVLWESKAGEVSEDGMFGIEACRCVGACGLAPVVMVNGEVYGRLVQADVQSICDKYMNE